jgi:hypothetical protein
MRPSRASPSGTSEVSSTVPPKQRARRVSHDRSGIAGGVEAAGDEAVEGTPVRAGDIKGAIQGHCDRGLRRDGGDIFGGDRLVEAARNAERSIHDARLGDGAEKSHELCGTDGGRRLEDGIEDRGSRSPSQLCRSTIRLIQGWHILSPGTGWLRTNLHRIFAEAVTWEDVCRRFNTVS